MSDMYLSVCVKCEWVWCTVHMHIGFSYVLQCAYTCIRRKLSRLKKVQVSYQLTYMPCVGTCRHGSSDVITSHIHNFSLKSKHE